MSDLSDSANPNISPGVGQQMSSLPATVYGRYASEIVFYTTLIQTLEAQITAIAASTAEEYDITSGDGRHKVKRRSLQEVIADRNSAAAQLRFYEQKNYGRGIMNLNLRRK
jgi:hypothetical protein